MLIFDSYPAHTHTQQLGTAGHSVDSLQMMVAIFSTYFSSLTQGGTGQRRYNQTMALSSSYSISSKVKYLKDKE